MRLLALLVIVAPILAAAAMGHSGPGIASACGTYPPLFEEALRDARLVVIGTTQSVGDNSNRFPTTRLALP